MKFKLEKGSNIINIEDDTINIGDKISFMYGDRGVAIYEIVDKKGRAYILNGECNLDNIKYDKFTVIRKPKEYKIKNNFQMYDIIFYKKKRYVFVSYCDESKEYGYFETMNHPGFFRYSGYRSWSEKNNVVIPEEYISECNSNNIFIKIKMSDILEELDAKHIDRYDVVAIKIHNPKGNFADDKPEYELLDAIALPGFQLYGGYYVELINGEGLTDTSKTPINTQFYKKGNGNYRFALREDCIV